MQIQASIKPGTRNDPETFRNIPEHRIIIIMRKICKIKSNKNKLVSARKITNKKKKKKVDMTAMIEGSDNLED